MHQRYVIGVDPGTHKGGVAVIRGDGTVIERRVVEAPNMGELIAGWMAQYQPEAVVVGDRTGSEAFRRQLRDELEALGVDPTLRNIVAVDEHRTSMEARRRYLVDHRRGWRRLWPLSLQAPAGAFDDYVAIILAERYLAPGR